MPRTFQNPANNYTETVSVGSSFAAFFLGLIYLAYKGLWAHVFIWFLVVVVPGVMSGGPLLVFTLPLTSIFYGLGIQQILAKRYLNRGWREVVATPTHDDRALAAETTAVLSGPDPMIPRKPAVADKSDYKLCPFCAEEVKAAAVRCKHCQADLSAAA